MSDPSPSQRVPSVAIIAAPEDAIYMEECTRHLAILERTGCVSLRTPLDILPGDSLEKALYEEFATSDIVILLVSVDLLSSPQYAPFLNALLMNPRWTIPVLLRDVHLSRSAIASLPLLPRNRTPVASWKSRDRAWLEVAQAIEELVDSPRRSARPDDPSNLALHRMLVEAGQLAQVNVLPRQPASRGDIVPARFRSPLVIASLLLGALLAAIILHIDFPDLVIPVVLTWGVYKCTEIAKRPHANRKSVHALTLALAFMLLRHAFLIFGLRLDSKVFDIQFIILTGASISALVTVIALAVRGLLEIRASKQESPLASKLVYTQGTGQAVGALILSIIYILPVSFFGLIWYFLQPDRRASVNTAPDWTDFTSPARDFAVSFPGAPKDEASLSSTANGTAVARIYSTTYAGEIYAVRADHRPMDANNTAQHILDDWENRTRAMPGVQILPPSKHTQDTGDERELIYALDTTQTIRIRIIVAENQVFALMLIIPGVAHAEATQDESAEHFFSSFTLMPSRDAP